MTLSIKETIEELGVAELSKASGIPYSTIYRWAEQDKVPGAGTRHDWRMQQLMRAVEKVRADKAAQQPSEAA